MGDAVINHAKKLRDSATTAEDKIWWSLRCRQIDGRKWRRQHPIDQFIVDFFCPELRLVIEIDGDVHAFQEKRDTSRQAYLESQGLTVVRFTNHDVFENLQGVLETIWRLTQRTEEIEWG